MEQSRVLSHEVLNFRWWEEELLELFAKPNGKAKTLRSRRLRVNLRGKPSSLRLVPAAPPGSDLR